MDDLAVDSDEEVDYSKMDQVTTTPCMHYCFVQFLIRTNLLLTASLSFSASDAKLAFKNTPKQWTTNLSIMISVSDVTTQTWNKSISFYSFIIYTSWGYLYLWYPTRITIHKLTWILRRRRRRGANFFCLIKCLVFYNDIDNTSPALWTSFNVFEWCCSRGHCCIAAHSVTADCTFW